MLTTEIRSDQPTVLMACAKGKATDLRRGGPRWGRTCVRPFGPPHLGTMSHKEPIPKTGDKCIDSERAKQNIEGRGSEGGRAKRRMPSPGSCYLLFPEDDMEAYFSHCGTMTKTRSYLLYRCTSWFVRYSTHCHQEKHRAVSHAQKFTENDTQTKNNSNSNNDNNKRQHQQQQQ